MTGPPKMNIDRSAPARLAGDDDVLARVLEMAGGSGVYVVGGTVRDAMIGERSGDLDVVIEGPVAALAQRLDPGAVLHERFDTAELTVDGRNLDLARSRAESYPRPGALPEVEPAPIETDLARRDFTINAMAVPIDEPRRLLDPCGGADDLERRAIRVIHDRSFVDDPTRALRAARYAARLGFDVDHRTADLLPAVDLGTVSEQRVKSELELMAEEPSAIEATRLATAWGLIELPPDGLVLLAGAFETLAMPQWQGFCSRSQILEALTADPGLDGWRDLTGYPGSPSRASEALARRDPVEIVLARGAGAEWIDSWVTDWRGTTLEITGDDLVAEGIASGRAVGAGLGAALTAALDRGVKGRDGQLAVALEAARRFGEDGTRD